MANAAVIKLSKEWWKEDRKPSSDLIIKKKPKFSDKYYSVKEIANRLGVGIWGIYDFINSGELDAQIIGRRKRISQEALEEFLIRQNNKRRVG